MRYLVLAVLTGCTAPASIEPQGLTLDVVYEAPTATRADLTSVDCVNTVIRTHVHASWKSFARFSMNADGTDRWTLRFTGMQPGRYSLRVDDINLCGISPGGTVTAPQVLANGVRLSKQVDTPQEGGGTRPGFSFDVRSDGGVAVP